MKMYISIHYNRSFKLWLFIKQKWPIGDLPRALRCWVHPESETGSWSSGLPVPCGSLNIQCRWEFPGWWTTTLGLREKKDAMVTNARNSFICHPDPNLMLPLTGCSAVTAHVVSGHPLHLHQDRLGELLNDVVLTNMLVSFKGLIQRLLLTVLEHRDPA